MRDVYDNVWHKAQWSISMLICSAHQPVGTPNVLEPRKPLNVLKTPDNILPFKSSFYHQSRQQGNGEFVPQHFHVERSLQVAEIIADHLLAETFAREKKPCHWTRSVVDKLTSDQVPDSRLRLPIREQTVHTHIHLNRLGHTRGNLSQLCRASAAVSIEASEAQKWRYINSIIISSSSIVVVNYCHFRLLSASFQLLQFLFSSPTNPKKRTVKHRYYKIPKQYKNDLTKEYIAQVWINNMIIQKYKTIGI